MVGNPPPRLFETAAGMLNAIGLQNVGVRAFLDEKLPKLRRLKNIVVFANVFGNRFARITSRSFRFVLNEADGYLLRPMN